MIFKEEAQGGTQITIRHTLERHDSKGGIYRQYEKSILGTRRIMKTLNGTQVGHHDQVKGKIDKMNG